VTKRDCRGGNHRWTPANIPPPLPPRQTQSLNLAVCDICLWFPTSQCTSLQLAWTSLAAQRGGSGEGIAHRELAVREQQPAPRPPGDGTGLPCSPAAPRIAVTRCLLGPAAGEPGAVGAWGAGCRAALASCWGFCMLERILQILLAVESLPAEPQGMVVFFLTCSWFAPKVVTLRVSPTWECT